MRELKPISHRIWFRKHCGKVLDKYMPGWGSHTTPLPMQDIDPEHIVMERNLPVEFMVLCLWRGAWIKDDWRPYVRYAIHNRLKNRKDLLFSPVFNEVIDVFFEFQLEGGTFTRRKYIRSIAADIVKTARMSQKDKTAAMILFAATNELEDNNLMQPFHWIRATLGFTQDCSSFGVNMVNSEMHRQKVTLCKMLRGPYEG